MNLRRQSESGVALIVALLAVVLLSTVGIALVLTTSAESRIAGNFRSAQQARYAADAGAERALDDLFAIVDWNTLLAGGVVSTFADGPPTGARQLDDGSAIDLSQVVNVANCQKPAGCSVGDMNAVTQDRPWGANNPRWQLFAFGRLRDLLPPDSMAPGYLVVMVGDDPGEVDSDPTHDSGPGTPGAGVVAVRAEAFGPGGAHKVVELTAARGQSAMRVLSWREVR